MSDSFYSIKGEKLYFSTDATKLLYQVLIYFGEKTLSPSLDTQEVINWLKNQVTDGIESSRAFDLKDLPPELKGDQRLLALMSLLAEFHIELSKKDPQFNRELTEYPWTDQDFKQRWINKIETLRKFISEIISKENKPSNL